jgi:hypothetical protein
MRHLFSVWLISFSIMSSSFVDLVASGRISFFSWLNYICTPQSYLHPFTGDQTLGLFPSLGYGEKCCNVHGSVCIALQC